MEAVVWYWQVTRLAAGIYGFQDASIPVAQKQAFWYALAALEAGQRYGVDPWELVAIARNESALREDDVGPDGKDCGITQTRITGSRYTCRQLRRSFRLGFLEAGRELAEYAASCRGRADFDRCRFNRYNSGIRYARRGWNGRYWLRVMCYAESARAGASGEHCLGVASRRDVARAIDRDSARTLATIESGRKGL